MNPKGRSDLSGNDVRVHCRPGEGASTAILAVDYHSLGFSWAQQFQGKLISAFRILDVRELKPLF